MAKVPRSLAGLTIAITGGARGIGRATAKALLAQGARVVIGDIEQPLAEQTAAELGSGTVGLPLDVTDRESFTAFLDEVEQRLGPLDVLINNAGIMPLGPLVQESDATAQRIIDINVHGVILGSKLAIERFLPRHRGHLVEIASATGKIGFSNAVTYSASKHAVVGIAESLRQELRGTGIDVTVVMPTAVNTELGSGLGGLGLLGGAPADERPGANAGRADGLEARSAQVLDRLQRVSHCDLIVGILGDHPRPLAAVAHVADVDAQRGDPGRCQSSRQVHVAAVRADPVAEYAADEQRGARGSGRYGQETAQPLRAGTASRREAIRGTAGAPCGLREALGIRRGRSLMPAHKAGGMREMREL